MYYFNKTLLVLLLLSISFNKAYCQNSKLPNIRYKGFVEIGLGKILKDVRWNTFETSDNSIDIKHSEETANELLNFNSFTYARAANGIFIKEKYFTGISAGFDQLKGTIYNTPLNILSIPIGIDSKIYFLKGQFRPMACVNIGRSFIISPNKVEFFQNYFVENFKSRNYMQISVGFQLLVSSKSSRAFNFNIGYNVQRITSRFIVTNPSSPTSEWSTIGSLNFITLNAGYSF